MFVAARSYYKEQQEKQEEQRRRQVQGNNLNYKEVQFVSGGHYPRYSYLARIAYNYDGEFYRVSLKLKNLNNTVTNLLENYFRNSEVKITIDSSHPWFPSCSFPDLDDCYDIVIFTFTEKYKEGFKFFIEDYKELFY